MVGLMLPGMKGAFARGKSTGMLFAIMAVYLSILWWGCESLNCCVQTFSGVSYSKCKLVLTACRLPCWLAACCFSAPDVLLTCLHHC